VNTTSNCEEKRKREDERAAKCAGTQEYLQTKILIDTAQKAADRLERPWWGAISYVVPRVMQARCEEFAGAIMSAVNELNLSCYTAGIVYSEEKNRLGNPWHVAVVAYRPGAHPSTGLILDAWPHGKLKVSTAENWYAGFGDFRPELSRIEPEFGDDLCPMTPVMLPR
jgi:hypothetical protein